MTVSDEEVPFETEKARFQLASDYKYVEPTSHTVSVATSRLGRVSVGMHFFKQAIIPTEDASGKPTMERVTFGLATINMSLDRAKKLAAALDRAVKKAESTDASE